MFWRKKSIKELQAERKQLGEKLIGTPEERERRRLEKDIKKIRAAKGRESLLYKFGEKVVQAGKFGIKQARKIEVKDPYATKPKKKRVKSLF